MAEVTLTFGTRRHTVACPDGQEEHLRSLGAMLAANYAVAEKASGGLSGERTMLFVALMLADSLDEANRRPAPSPAVSHDEVLLGLIAEQLEMLAHRLEQ
ncbi:MULTISPECIES: cell division protein ZapA [unclassified Sphingomonas]|uniref:cell division protein ZapA n=1 Tax=unclassified Sphingomonas TaxID=196159 RepID=UPI0002897A4C|nr:MULTISPECIES: cell division protein ZapA [unclassified Sphingomonas]